MTLISFVSRFQPCSFITIFTLTGLIADMHAEQIPMTPERRPAPPGKVEFLQHHGEQALRAFMNKTGEKPVQALGWPPPTLQHMRRSEAVIFDFIAVSLFVWRIESNVRSDFEAIG